MNNENNAQGYMDMQARVDAVATKGMNQARRHRMYGSAARILKTLSALLLLLACTWTGAALAGSTTTTVTASPSSSKVGQSVAITATVTGASPTGTVTFMDGATTVGTATLNGSGVATLSYSFLTYGSHGLTATYGGDANNNTSTSSTFWQWVGVGDTTTSLVISPNPAQIGQTVTLTSTVTGTSPTGSVTFFYAYPYSGVLGTAPLVNGVATLTQTFTSAANWPIASQYNGDTNNLGSRSSTVTLAINPVTSTTVFTSSINPSVPNQSVTLTATVTGSSPTRYVTFYDGSTVLNNISVVSGVATLNYTFTTMGAHNLTAYYVGDNNNTSSRATLTQTVALATSATTLASGANPAMAGQAVTLTATVSGSSPSGIVTFKDGTTTLGSSTITNGTASLNYTFTVTGAHSLTAVYGGDANNTASTSAVVSQTVNGTATTTALTSSLNPATTGQSVTLTATVTGTSPTGTVTFKDGAATLGTGTIANGTASLSYTFTTTGTHSLTASYAGDANNGASTSAALTQTVMQATAATTLTSGANPSIAGQAITLTATVSGYNPSGTVTFNNGAIVLGTVPLTGGTATLSYAFATAGTHGITAFYSGDANNIGNTSANVWQTVNTASTAVTLSSSLSASSAGQAVTLTANVTGASPSGSVTFMDGTTPLGAGTLIAGIATYNVAFTTAGTHSLTASYAGDANNTAATSSAITQTVAQANSTISLASSANPAAMNQAVILTAGITGSSPTGSVTFMDGATTIGTGTITNGSASLSTTFTTMGAHSLTASYAGDANNTAATSTALTQTVGKANSSVTLASGTNPATLNQAVTLTATLTGTSPTGSITFLDGTTTIGTAAITNGTASLSVTFTVPGNHPLTASYLGDANNNPTTSLIDNQSVPGQATTYYYIQDDQLDTPRTITDTQGNVVWEWQNTDPFGSNVPNENPSGQGQFTCNLRYPGQYFDKETGLAYNFFRDYDPATGRYIQSDLIGLEGGVNTYIYALENPLFGIDRLGLNTDAPAMPDEPPSPSALSILSYYKNEMERKSIRGPSDQVFHCIASCKAKKDSGSPTGYIRWLLNRKEDRDYVLNLFGGYGNRKRLPHSEMIQDMDADKKVNEVGLQCPDNVSCEEQCKPFIEALPSKSRKLMKQYLRTPEASKYPG